MIKSDEEEERLKQIEERASAAVMGNVNDKLSARLFGGRVVPDPNPVEGSPTTVKLTQNWIGGAFLLPKTKKS
jgi:hypothetical protein